MGKCSQISQHPSKLLLETIQAIPNDNLLKRYQIYQRNLSLRNNLLFQLSPSLFTPEMLTDLG